MNKWLLITFLFFVSYLILLNFSGSEAAEDCYDGECGSWQECQYGTMCCYNDNGCPSWDCQDNGCCWFGTETGTGVCRKKTCTKWACVNPDTLKPCTIKSGQCVSPCGWECDGDWVCPASANATASCSYDTDAKCRYCTGVPPCTTTAPETVSLSSPTKDAILINQPQITLSWNAPSSWGENCDGNNTKKYKVEVDKDNDAEGFQAVCDNITETTCTFNADMTGNVKYYWHVIADNGAKTSTSETRLFTDNVGVNLEVTVEETPHDTQACMGFRLGAMENVKVYINFKLGGEGKSQIGTTGADGKFTTFVRYADIDPDSGVAWMELCSSYYAPAMCQVYELRCPPAPTGCTRVEQVSPGTTEQGITLQLAKVVKDPWFVAVDGDAAAGTFTSVGPCLSNDVEGGFYGGMLNLYSLSAPANIYAISVGDSTVTGDIAEGSGGGYVKNVGVADSDMGEISLKPPASPSVKQLKSIPQIIDPGVYEMTADDFNSYASGNPKMYTFPYPGCSSKPIDHPPMGSATSICTPKDKCFDINYPPFYCRPGCESYFYDKCLPGTYFTGDFSPRVAVVYIEGNPIDTVEIKAPIRKFPLGYAGGHLLLLTRAKVKIDPSVGHDDISTFTIDTPSQIDAVIVSSSGIEVSEEGDTVPMNPVVFSGVLANLKGGSPSEQSGKGMSLIRDLGINNNTYPGVVVKYPLTLLMDINEFIRYENSRGRETGLETFDVQYEFENVQEKVN